MGKQRFIAWICALLLLSGCAAAAPQREVNDFREDYERLWAELERSYPYLPYLTARGIDVPALRTRYAEAVPDAADEAAFAALLRRMFSEMDNFAHLDLVTPELYRTYYAYYMPGGETSDAFREVLTDRRLSARYQPPDSAAAAADAAGRPEVTALYYPDCKALHLRISSFAQELVDRDAGVVTAALDRYPEAEHIVFDITGNGGGSDWYWIQDLVAPFGGSYEFACRGFFSGGGLHDRFFPDAPSVPVSELTDAPDWAEELGLDRCVITRMTLPFDGVGEPTAEGNRARRWLLVDGRVYSAADKFACFCRSTGWATLVGTPTAGDGLGVAPVLLLLPDSGLLVRFSSEAGENPDGTMNAARGTAPDVACIRSRLPLSQCLELIRRGGAAPAE